MARPTKLTPETQAAIIAALSIGATYKDASEAAGVWYTTFLDWMKAGETATGGKFYEFYNAVKRTEAEARNNYLRTIAEAAKDGDWRAALEYLKRRDRANWGDNIDLSSGGEKIKGFDYGALVAGVTARPVGDSDTPGQD
jgi:hypothetical protein